MAKMLTVNKNPEKKKVTGGPSLAELGEQIRELKAQVPNIVSIASIPVMEVFENLFPIKPHNLERITESIKANGFDEKFSVIIAQFPDGSRSLAAGFTRKKGARNAGKTEIYAWTMDFPSIEAGVEWALHEQYDRRNLSDDEIYESVLRIDEFTKQGKNGLKGKSSIKTAEIAGISARKVERIRTVNREASENQKEAIRSGQKSINGVYQEVREKRKAPSGANSKNPTTGKNKAPSGASIEPVTTLERNWSIEIRGQGISLIRENGDEVPLVNFSAMAMLYNGAPETKLRKVVEEYMEKVL